MPRFRILSILMPLGMLGFVVTTVMAMGNRPPATNKETAASAASKPPVSNRDGEQIYKTYCHSCHSKGAAGAPKVGDKEAWAPRIDAGVAGLLYSVITGKNAMPPRAGITDVVTDDELRRAVVFMANKSGANFK
jgi:cytochrome c5